MRTSRPWMSLWRPFPLRWRRSVAWTLARPPSCAPVRGLARALTRPPGAWLAFNINFLFWHLPGPYDLTLQNTYVHILEHTTFLLFGILFWALVTKAKLPYSWRIGYLAAAMMIHVGLSITLAFAQHPLYARMPSWRTGRAESRRWPASGSVPGSCGPPGTRPSWSLLPC